MEKDAPGVDAFLDLMISLGCTRSVPVLEHSDNAQLGELPVLKGGSVWIGELPGTPCDIEGERRDGDSEDGNNFKSVGIDEDMAFGCYDETSPLPGGQKSW